MGFRLANVSGRAALVAADQWYDLERVSGGSLGPDPMATLAAHRDLHDVAAGLGDREPDGPLGGADLGPPSPRPRNCYGIGLNYRSHAEETGAGVPDEPVVFTKFPSCLVGPNADVVLRSETADYEAEVVVVIGTGGRDIPADRAWEHVAGLTAGQDISDRRLQFASNPPHFDLGKSRDTYGPTGPVVVSPDVFADRDAVALACTVAGEPCQDDTTANLLFPVPELVAYLSAVSTLAPGDLVFTGTPDGVGMAKGRFLSAGDVITTTVEEVGTLVNRCTSGG